ncbi:replication protein [Moraxella nasibovis]|uniref:replication protein n=1 Tax=Moraxella nasibovis TaxID=2904120 RepID=UPI00240FF772|nr:replication protein [Moraxella nasibovis]WFF39269.1 replication protein [Moraxella nasibovis]
MSKFIANSFQVPNALIDEVLDKMSGNACKIYLLIVRKTRGWNKEADRISYTQIQKYTGINHRATISKAIDELLEMGLIIVAKGNEKSSNEYRLNDDFCSKNEQEPSSKNEQDNKCTSSKNEPASSKNEQEPSSKNEHTEIHIFKNTRIKNKSVSTHEHTHENQDFQTQKNHGEKQTTLDNSKSKKNNSSDKKSKSELRLNPNGIEKPDELDNQIWLDFLKIKKQRTREDLSVTAWNRFINQVVLAQQKTNHSLDELFGYWIGETNWKGFNCDWYLQRQQPQNNFSQPNRMNELRQMANANPVTDVFINDLPPQFYALGANHE